MFSATWYKHSLNSFTCGFKINLKFVPILSYNPLHERFIQIVFSYKFTPCN